MRMRERLATIPLRTQVLALLLVTVALVVALLSLASTAVLRSYLVDRVDTQLRETLREPMRPGPAHLREHRLRQDVAVQLLQYDASGRPSPETAARQRFGGPSLTDPAGLARDRPTEVDGTRGSTRWRVLARPDRRTGGTVVAAVALDGVDDTVSRLLVVDAGVGLVALVGGGLLARVAVRRSLRPLVTVEETAHAIAAGDLGVRVPAADPRTEVGSLAASFNAMVDRFQSAYLAQQKSEAQARESEQRMRQFVADASHELRTPLTSIRGFAELFRQGAASDPDQLHSVMRRIEDEAARMGLLVEDLLLLARLDQARPLREEPVDLLSVAADVVSAARTVHSASHSVRLRGGDGGLPVVLGDDARLHQVVSNLVANAVAHTPPGTAVDVHVQRQGEQVLLEVVDDGEGMTPEVASRAFERFYRADASRTRAASTSGSGLGLAIVAAIVAAHRGAAEVDSAPGRGTSVTVRLPAAP